MSAVRDPPLLDLTLTQPLPSSRERDKKSGVYHCIFTGDGPHEVEELDSLHPVKYMTQ